MALATEPENRKLTHHSLTLNSFYSRYLNESHYLRFHCTVTMSDHLCRSSVPYKWSDLLRNILQRSDVIRFKLLQPITRKYRVAMSAVISSSSIIEKRYGPARSGQSDCPQQVGLTKDTLINPGAISALLPRKIFQRRYRRTA